MSDAMPDEIDEAEWRFEQMRTRAETAERERDEALAREAALREAAAEMVRALTDVIGPPCPVEGHNEDGLSLPQRALEAILAQPSPAVGMVELRADVAALREALSDLLNYTRKVEGLAAVTLARYSRLPEEGATELGDRCRAILDRPHPGEDMVLVSRERLDALERLATASNALREQFGDNREMMGGHGILEYWGHLFREYDDALDALRALET